jgi:octaprenyl-diphosphate synthase
VALLNKLYYIINRRENKCDPMFGFLTAKISAGTVNERTYRGACVVELIPPLLWCT